MTFWWLLPLLCKGFLKPLEVSDLASLAEKDTCRYHYDQFLFIYKARKVSKKKVTFRGLSSENHDNGKEKNGQRRGRRLKV